MFQKRVNRRMRKAGQLPLTACLSIFIACGAVNAQEPNAAPRYSFEQPSQSMGESLRSIARVTGKSVLFESGFVAGKTARPVNGQMSALEAVRAALEGSDLTARLVADGTILVRPIEAAEPGKELSQGNQSETPSGRSDSRTTAQDEQGLRGAPGTEGGAATAAQANSGSVQELERVEVTGSRLKRIASDGPTPVNVYTKKDIEKSGQPNLERFLSSLNEVSASTGEGGNGKTLGQGTVQLRGLPLGSTLVLINGRRVQAVGSSSANFFNLNLIPMAAVERVEIVPVGSSAVYGGDALAGVVNVILRKSIDGQSINAKYGGGKGFDDSTISMATGGQSAKGSYLLMGSYGKSTPLMTTERNFFKDADYRRFGGPDARQQYCAPGTVSSINGANLPGLNSSLAGIPNNTSSQKLQISDFAATAGNANLCSIMEFGNGLSLVHGRETVGLHALAELSLAGSWSTFGEFTYANEHMGAKERGIPFSSIVPASNPFNPFGTDVSVTSFLGVENGTAGLERQTKFTRALVGLRGDVTADWEAEVTASIIQDRGGSQQFYQNTDGAALMTALASTNPSNALNPFTSNLAASKAVINGIWSDTVTRNKGRREQVAGLIRGPLLQMPAGPLDAILGGEVTSDHYDVSAQPFQLQINNSRRDRSAYGELRAPLINSEKSGRSDWNIAALTLAARHDSYSDFGSANTYQGGLEVRPSRALLIRASSATSFKPPTLLQTNIVESGFPLAWVGLTDPSRGGEAITTGNLLRTANKDLGPERGRAKSLGVVWEPEGMLGTRLSLAYWQVRIRDLIAVLNAQTLLNNEKMFPGLVTRGPAEGSLPGKVLTLRQSEVNFGSVDTAGTDIEVTHAWRGLDGRWTAAATATRTQKYQVLLLPDIPVENRLSQRFDDFWAPRWKGRVLLTYEHGGWGVGLASRYLGGYSDSGNSPRHLGDYWIHDLSLNFDLKKLLPGIVTGVKSAIVGLSVANMANRMPQFIQAFPYYDVTQADWRGRYMAIQASVDW